MNDSLRISSVPFAIASALAVALTLFSPGNRAWAKAPYAAAPAAAKIKTETLQAESIRIEVDQLPDPRKDESVRKNSEVVPVPEDAVLQVPAGFTVSVLVDGVERPRWLALTPEGDLLCATSKDDKVYLLRDLNRDGVIGVDNGERRLFYSKGQGANQPFGMDFAQIDGQWWFYVANTNAVRRYEYTTGQTQLEGPGQLITQLPGQGYNQHWTRNCRVSPDRKHLFVTVGSKSNASVEAPPRAAILRLSLDGTRSELFASGIRNPVGLDFHPQTGAVYVNVNERDELGDDLVPDYLAKVEQGEFYGWPYAYFTPKHLDPRRMLDGQSERPDLAKQTHMPDVLYQAHSAALGLAFTRGEMFPAKYRGGAFTAMRGSWNRSAGTGYKLVYIPFDESGQPRGDYEDFLTGFLIDPTGPTTWGRPVGVLFAPDGSLLFTEEMNGRIYRVTYDGE